METLDPEGVDDKSLARLRERLAKRTAEMDSSRYTEALRGDDVVQRMLAGDWPMQWSSKYGFVSDDPAKVTMKKRDVKRTHVGVALVPMIQAAEERVTIVSPYFVPGDEVTAGLAHAAGEGKSVRILTNSLVANDVAAVHGGYSRYRKPLLRGGVQLWELKPVAGGAQNSSLFGSSGASLHTKAFAVDGKTLFVGSYNLDPRSTWLNCEQGVLVENEALARELEALFDAQVAGQHAWRVTFEDGGLRWSDGESEFSRDPEASGWLRIQAWITRMLHLDAQL
jgi:putative cardiolipin synthase